MKRLFSCLDRCKNYAKQLCLPAGRQVSTKYVTKIAKKLNYSEWRIYIIYQLV
jgi:hypothetical protein